MTAKKAAAKKAATKRSAAMRDETAPSVPEFDRIADVLRREGGVDPAPPPGGKRAFGAGALKVNAKIFAMPAQGTLVLKLPAARVDALVAKGRGARFDPGHGRVMKEWIALRGGEKEWLALAREALVFVRG